VTVTHLNIVGNVVLRYTVTRMSCRFHSPSPSLQLSLAYFVTNSSTSGYREVQMFWRTCYLHLLPKRCKWHVLKNHGIFLRKVSHSRRQ